MAFKKLLAGILLVLSVGTALLFASRSVAKPPQEKLAVRAQVLTQEVINTYPAYEQSATRIQGIFSEIHDDLVQLDPAKSALTNETMAHQLEDKVFLPRMPELQREVAILKRLSKEESKHLQELQEVLSQLEQLRQSGEVQDTVLVPLQLQSRSAKECVQIYQDAVVQTEEYMKMFELIAERHRQRTPKCDKFR